MTTHQPGQAWPDGDSARMLLAEFIATGRSNRARPCAWPGLACQVPGRARPETPAAAPAGAGPDAFDWPDGADVEYNPRTGHWAAALSGWADRFSHRDIAVVHEMVTRAGG